MKRQILKNAAGKRAVSMLLLTLLVGIGFLAIWKAVQNAEYTRAQADYDGDGIGDFVLLRFPANGTPRPISWYVFKSGGIAYTGSGSNVKVQGNGATVIFPQVTATGETTFTPIVPPSAAGTAPAGYTILGAGPAVNITTTAGYTPPVAVCLTVSSVNDLPTFLRLRVLHSEGGQLVDRTVFSPDPLSPNFALRRVCGRVTSLSPFAAALVGPLAAGVGVSGRVLTSEGRGLSGAKVIITDQSGMVRTAVTGKRGTYTFQDIEPGRTYVISVGSRRYHYSPQILEVTDNLTSVDFVPDE